MSAEIVITGYGACGGGGSNCAELWENCRLGRSPARTRSQGRPQVPVYAADDPTLSHADAHLVKKAGRAAALAIAAVREAWQHGGLASAGFDPARVGVIVGSSRGPADLVDASFPKVVKRPSEAVYTAFSSLPGIIASTLNLEGCAISVSATCTSGAAAIHSALLALRAGELDIVLAGGVDAPLIDSILQRMTATGVVSASADPKSALRPFDLHRDGTVLGEGAAFVILETANSAEARGAEPHARVLGAAVGCEPHSRSRPTEDSAGLQQVALRTLKQGGVALSEIDLLHLHGTGTRINDLTESRCVKALFGPRDDQPMSWATKGITGHTLGGASSFQVVLTLLAMRHSFLPGTTNCSEPDPECPIRLSVGKGSTADIRNALCMTSGFWGKNASVLLSR